MKNKKYSESWYEKKRKEKELKVFIKDILKVSVPILIVIIAFYHFFIDDWDDFKLLMAVVTIPVVFLINKKLKKNQLKFARQKGETLKLWKTRLKRLKKERNNFINGNYGHPGLVIVILMFTALAVVFLCFSEDDLGLGLTFLFLSLPVLALIGGFLFLKKLKKKEIKLIRKIALKEGVSAEEQTPFTIKDFIKAIRMTGKDLWHYSIIIAMTTALIKILDIFVPPSFPMISDIKAIVTALAFVAACFKDEILGKHNKEIHKNKR